MPQSTVSAIHCINPDCPSPILTDWGNNFCQNCGAPLRLNNRYVPLQRLGSGGFAVTYTVYDMHSKIERVLKVLVESSPKVLELFEQEARVLASLRHPGIPKVEADNYFQISIGYPPRRVLPCLVMEKINGPTLQDILSQYPQGCPESDVIDWLKQAVEILRQLHTCHIIHRDLKPANFMLRMSPRSYQGPQWGQLVAIDFGGVKQLGSLKPQTDVSSTRLFSPGYSPPEQFAGGTITPGADFYALGRTFIHLLTGRYPVDLENPRTGELEWRSLVKVTPALADLLDEMVQANLSKRPTNAAEVQNRLARISRNLIRAKKNRLFPSIKIQQSLTNWLGLLLYAIATIIKSIFSIVISIYKFIFGIIFSCTDTLWGTILGGIGAGGGSLIGLGVFQFCREFLNNSEYESDLLKLNSLSCKINFIFNIWLPHHQISFGPEIFLFGFAGLGTAYGLTLSGSFRQQREFWLSGFMGSIGYLFGILILFLQIADLPTKYLTFTSFAIGSLTLGLGLPSHNFIHAVFATIITTIILLGLSQGIGLNLDWWVISCPLDGLDSPQILTAMTFLIVLGSSIGLSLGISSYIFIPFLSFLGFR